jgi:NADH-quinone oxidoreductase subunit J
MLTTQGPFVSMKTSGGDWILAFLLSGSLLAFLVPAAFSVSDWRGPASTVGAPVPRDTADRLGLGLLGVRVDKLEDRPLELRSGMSGYLLPFEIVSVHLLVVLVGAAYLARAKRRAASRAS